MEHEHSYMCEKCNCFKDVVEIKISNDGLKRVKLSCEHIMYFRIKEDKIPEPKDSKNIFK